VTAGSEIACRSCGAANPAANRFCGACGSALVGSAAAGPLEERKVVTMLFADLTASTELASRLDPEDLRAILGPFYDAMAAEIDRFGGTVEKFIGDAVVAAFGAPVAHEDDPERAVRCALAMHRRLAELNREISERAGGDLAMRIGVNTGEVIAHAIEEGIVTGEAVNIAARFQALAEPGRVLVGERTHRVARGAFSFTDLGEVTVKGVDRPLRVWRVEGELAEPRSTSPALPAPFVGRASELELLAARFERTARDRTPTLVTIVGAPGIGKSRLAQELLGTLDDARARIVRGRCLPYGDGLTYWPLAEILKADAGIRDSDPADTILRKAHARLDPRFPGDEGMGVAGVLLSSIGVEVPSDPLAGAELEAARRMVARAWQRYLGSMAAEGPLVALVEDLHWADPSLLALIEEVVHGADGPLLLLCTARPELFERHPAWGGDLPKGTRIVLSPLTAGEGVELIERLLTGGAPAEVVGPILQRSEGNPFFAGELLRMMVEDGTLARRDGRWVLERELPSALPDTVQGVIASRIDLLPSEEKRAIQDASVVGRAFWEGALVRLGMPEVGPILDSLLDKGLVVERPASAIEGERELAFNHVLTRDVAYAGIPRSRRARAHAEIGSWIEEVTSGRDEEFAEILAHHASLAGDAQRTARFAMLAGRRHLRVFAAEQALEWYGRALSAIGEGDQASRARASLGRGGALEQVGRFADALEAYREARGRAEEASDAELEARALAAEAHVLWLLDRYDEGDELLPVALERARKVGLADVEARLLYTAGTISFGRARFADALGFHERALEVARSNRDREGEALAHHGLCETFFFLGPPQRALEHGTRADALLRELGQKPMVAHNGYMISWAQGFLGRWDDALATVEASIAGCRDTGSRRDEAFALFNRVQILLMRGNVGGALEDAEAGIRIAQELDLRRGEIVGRNVLADVLGELWALEELARSSDVATEACEALGGGFQRSMVLSAAAWVALWRGDLRGAERLFELSHRSALSPLDVGWSGQTEVLAWEWAGDADRLDRLADWLAERLEPSDAIWLVWGAYARALAALLRERWDDAARLAEDALAMAGSLGHRRVAWRSARVLATARGRLGLAEEAEASRRVARSHLEGAIGSTPAPLRAGFLARPDVAELMG
jgi:class 3 adenylate cyclase/tetratricopeptide (TPR) repeat protein